MERPIPVFAFYNLSNEEERILMGFSSKDSIDSMIAALQNVRATYYPAPVRKKALGDTQQFSWIKECPFLGGANVGIHQNSRSISHETHFVPLQNALQSVDAGHIGNYDSCLSYSRVMGTWRPLDGTHPFIGEQGKISCEPEFKVEVTIRTEKLKETVAAIKQVHPYEEPVINAIPLIGIGL